MCKFFKGFSQSQDVQRCVGEDLLKVILKTYYNLKGKDLEAICICDSNTKWFAVEIALLRVQELTNCVITDVANEEKKTPNVTNKDYDNLVEARCLQNNVLKNSKLNLYRTALPCMSDDKRSELLEKHMSAACENIKNM